MGTDLKFWFDVENCLMLNATGYWTMFLEFLKLTKSIALPWTAIAK